MEGKCARNKGPKVEKTSKMVQVNLIEYELSNQVVITKAKKPNQLMKFLLTFCWIIDTCIPSLFGWIMLLVGATGFVIAGVALVILVFFYYPIASFAFGIIFLDKNNCPATYIPSVFIIGGIISMCQVFSLISAKIRQMEENGEKTATENCEKPEKVTNVPPGLFRRVIKCTFWVYWAMAIVYLIYAFKINTDHVNNVEKKSWFENVANCSLYFPSPAITVFFLLIPLPSAAGILCAFLAATIICKLSQAIGNPIAEKIFKSEDDKSLLPMHNGN